MGLLCGLAAAAIWGGGSAVSRHLVTSGLGPADLTLLRYVGCFPVALVALFLMGDRICIGVAWRHLAVLLILGGPLYHANVVAGYQYTSAGGGALLMSGLLPVFAIGLHWIVTSTTPPRTKVIGTIAVLAGLVWFGLGAGSILSPAGVVLFAIAAAAWAALNELVRGWQVDASAYSITGSLRSAFAPLYLLTGSGEVLASRGSAASNRLSRMAGRHWCNGAVFLAVRLAGTEIAAVLQAASPLRRDFWCGNSQRASAACTNRGPDARDCWRSPVRFRSGL